MVHPLTKNKICLKYFILIIVLSCFFKNYLNPYSCFHIQYFLNKHWDKNERKAAESAAVITLSEVRVKLWTQSKLSVSPEDTPRSARHFSLRRHEEEEEEDVGVKPERLLWRSSRAAEFPDRARRRWGLQPDRCGDKTLSDFWHDLIYLKKKVQ